VKGKNAEFPAEGPGRKRALRNVNAALLNEFLKEHKKVERQDRRIREQEAMITHLQSDLQAMAAAHQNKSKHCVQDYKRRAHNLK
jgi:type II secretory pathway component PulJ